MDLSMVTIKLTLCGSEPGNSPRASSLSGRCSEKNVCVFVYQSSLMFELGIMQSDAHEKDAYVQKVKTIFLLEVSGIKALLLQ